MRYSGYEETFDIKKATSSEILKKIDLKYYDAEIEQVKKRISNIRMGKPQFHGIYSTDKHIYTGAEAEREIKSLERYIERLKRQKETFSKLTSLARQASTEISSMARKEALEDYFYEAIRKVENHYPKNKAENEFALFDKKYQDAIVNARRKDTRKFDKPKRKIGKKLYHALKKYSKKMSLYINDRPKNLGQVFEESKKSMEFLFADAYYEKKQEYKKDKFFFGVESDVLERVSEIMDTDLFSIHELCVGDAASRYRDVVEIWNRETYSPIATRVHRFMKPYEDVLRRGRELKALKYILTAFSKSDMKDTAVYAKLQEVCKSIEQDVKKIVEELNRDFETVNLPTLIENYKKLEKLHRDYLFALHQHEISNQSQYSWSEYISQANSYRVEMYVIVLKYPELNRPEYKIDLTSKKKVTEEEVVKDHVKFTSEPKEEVTTILEPSIEQRKVNNIGDRLITPVNITIPKKMHIEKDTIDYDNDEELKKPIEVPVHLSGNVTYYYQLYMKEKMLQTELGKLKFSEFLESVRPDLKELIEVERKREKRVESIYKKYLKYRMALEDKSRAMSFKEFARIRYNLESYEIPQEYEDVIRKK